MSRLHLPIQDPCHENWDAMSREGDGRRFCESCTKHVHDLSAMTERKARSVLEDERTKGRVCVRYTADDAGNIKFIPETTMAPSMWRMTLAAASMTLALLTGCTDTAPDEVLEDRCVYEFGPWGFTAARGEGTCPSAEEPEPEPAEAEPQVVGEISIEPEPEPEPVNEVKGDIGPPEPIPTMGAPMMIDPDPNVVIDPIVPQETMGKIAIDPDPVEHQMMGDIAAPDDEPCDDPLPDPPREGPRRL